MKSANVFKATSPLATAKLGLLIRVCHMRKVERDIASEVYVHGGKCHDRLELRPSAERTTSWLENLILHVFCKVLSIFVERSFYALISYISS